MTVPGMVLAGFVSAGLVAVLVGATVYAAIRLDEGAVCRSPAGAAWLVLCGLLDVGICAVLMAVFPGLGWG